MQQTTRYHSDQISILPDTICEFFNEKFEFDITNDSDFKVEVDLYTFLRVLEHVVNTHQKDGTAWIEPFLSKIADYCDANDIKTWSERLDLLIKSNELSRCKFSIESIRSDVIRTLTAFQKILRDYEETEKNA